MFQGGFPYLSQAISFKVSIYIQEELTDPALTLGERYTTRAHFLWLSLPNHVALWEYVDEKSSEPRYRVCQVYEIGIGQLWK